jgi:NAD(P)-dependent dehydrogenase (short-subunit alcohol dehydrogenase family)
VDLGLEGRIVVVTGASRGIGFACASAFLQEGAKVVVVSRDPDRLGIAVARLHSVGDFPPQAVVADLTRPEDAKRVADEVLERFGAPDVLVNSAGAAKRTLPENLEATAWRLAMEAKYLPYIHAMDALLPAMAAQGRGSVVNVIGMGGKVAVPYHLPGGAANAALMLASVGLASVYGPQGVRVNAINPGATMTERVEEALTLEAKLRGQTRDEVLREGQAKVPLRRYASADDIAQVAVFLASDRASYVTGAIVPMDGGLTAVI